MNLDLITLLLVFLMALASTSRAPNGNHHNHHQRHNRKHHRTQENSLADKTKSQEPVTSKKREYPHINSLFSSDQEPKECCPSVVGMVELSYGFSRKDTVLQVYNNSSRPQVFHEISCKPRVDGKPCQFLASTLRPWSQCVQRYSYSYALVRDFPATIESENDWRLDYIRVRSGCACEIKPPR